MIAAGVLWAAGAFAQNSQCREEWRGYYLVAGASLEETYGAVQVLMAQFGVQPIGGPSVSLQPNTYEFILQALAFRNCIEDPRTDLPTTDKMNAALVAAGLPALVGKK